MYMLFSFVTLSQPEFDDAASSEYAAVLAASVISCKRYTAQQACMLQIGAQAHC